MNISMLVWQDIVAPVMLSLKTAAITLPLHLATGVLSGYLLTGKRSFFGSFADVIITLPLVFLPLVFPPIATGFLLLILLGRNGWIGAPLQALGTEIIFSRNGVFIASFIAGLPLVVKSVQAAIAEMSPSLPEAAWTLGKSKFETYLFVVLPAIRHSMFTGLILSLGRSFGEVGITLMLGGNIVGKTETVSLAIYNAVFEGNFEKAAVFSILLGILSFAMFYGLKKISKT